MESWKKEIYSYLKDEIQTGDILLRSSNAKFHGIPFSKLVQFLTKSRFSHASIVLRENDDITLVEVNDLGTEVMGLQAWLDYSTTLRLGLLRLKEKPIDFESRITEEIKKFIELDPDYDFTFMSEDEFYCTESVVYLYQQLGIEITEGYIPKEVVVWWAWPIFYVCNEIVGALTKGKIPLDVKLYFVGNDKQGILASPVLEKVFEV